MENKKPVYDLEERTTELAKNIIRLCLKLPKNSINYPIINQVVRSGGSVGANYREANDALGDKDFIRCMKISRKEAKETIHWLELLAVANPASSKETDVLIKEVIEIRNIFSSIIKKSSSKLK